MKQIFSLITLFFVASTLQAQTSTNPVYLNYDSNLDWATYISATGSVSNQPSMFFHLPYVGTTGNAVFEWDADDSGTRKTIYRFETSSDRIFEINGWNDGNSSDLWFGDDNDNKFYIADDGRVGMGNNAIDLSGTALDQLVVGDGTGSRGIVVYHGTNNDGGYAFANPSGNLTGRILYDYSESEIKFQYGSTDLITYGSNQIDLLKDTDVSGNLHIKESSTGAPSLLIQRKGYVGGAGGETGAEFGSLIFKNDHANDYGAMIKGVIGTNGWASAGALDFYTSSTSGYHFAMRINNDGNVGIGTSNPDQALTVKGKIHSEEIIVDLNVPGPDYVFEEDYDLPTLSEIEAFIKANKHLPEVPSAKEMEANGISLGEMNMLLLKKIEELTLHAIQQETNASKQQKLIQELMARLEKLERNK